MKYISKIKACIFLCIHFVVNAIFKNYKYRLIYSCNKFPLYRQYSICLTSKVVLVVLSTLQRLSYCVLNNLRSI